METWTTFLQTQHLTPLAAATLQQTVIADISDFGLIQVIGQDAEKFLQGQFTNDVRQVKPQRSQFSAWCTPQGRVIVNFHLFKRDTAYYLLLPANSVAPVLKRLQMFVLRSAVKLSDATENLAKFGIAGEQATQLLTDALQQQLPENIDDCVTHAGITVIRMRGESRYIVLGEVAAIKNLWQKLASSAIGVEKEVWQLFNVLAGVPYIDTHLSEVFVPQMLNLQALSAVSFKKGCYTGQEIVARMQYLASLKRRLYRATLRTDTPPQIGDELFTTAAPTQEIGKIINVIAHPAGSYHLLAVVAVDAVPTQPVCDRAGNALQWEALSYEVELR
jgi:hypothetical protein